MFTGNGMSDEHAQGTWQYLHGDNYIYGMEQATSPITLNFLPTLHCQNSQPTHSMLQGCDFRRDNIYRKRHERGATTNEVANVWDTISLKGTNRQYVHVVISMLL